MLAKVYSYGIVGLDSYPICIEVDVSRGLPSTVIVGLPDNAIRESKERIRSALKNSGFDFPDGRITINLSPADIKKEGPSFDLAMALGILAASRQIPEEKLSQYVFLGELSLNGEIRPIHGTLSIALGLDADRFKGLVLPVNNSPEAAMAHKTNIYPVKNLNEAVHFLSNTDFFNPYSLNTENLSLDDVPETDFADIKGQYHVKRGLEVAAAGGHNVLMIGPPGSGKTMLAQRLPGILPDMSFDEALEATKIHSVAGFLKSQQGILLKRPFRSPHHTTSHIALVGGGSMPKPGEVTLSHHGILFLDELPEFNRNALEALRQPLEDHFVTIARANKSLRFPSKFMLVAAMNPCCCGFLMDPKRQCQCSAVQIQKYLAKISGPLLDRIDIHLEVPTLPVADIFKPSRGEPSNEIKKRTTSARGIQHERFKNSPIFANAQMNHKQLEQFCRLETDAKDLLKKAIEELNLSARAHDRIIKVSRTIADLAASENITAEHIAEAVQYRSLDRNWWK